LFIEHQLFGIKKIYSQYNRTGQPLAIGFLLEGSVILAILSQSANFMSIGIFFQETDMTISDLYFSLAPTDLLIYRSDRYGGEGFGVSLQDFAPEDISLLIGLYGSIKKIYDLWLYMREQPNYELIGDQLIKEFGSDELRIGVQAIGSATYAIRDPSPLARKVMHDVRGGALSVLVGLATFLKVYPEPDEETIYQAITMARDHAKLMRNAIEDIDLLVRAADESAKIHPISDFVNKWQNLSFDIANKPVLVQVSCSFEGNITSRCLETSSIDRILYNYINNAARFTTDNKVSLTIFPVGDGLVRWVAQNTLAPQQKLWLQENVGDNLGRLFEGGITRGGHGLGLSSCADFVAASFGTETIQEAIQEGYLGAKIIDDQYYAWFHWPAYVASDPNEPICECAD
jgi:signal transduction histidine kinase